MAYIHTTFLLYLLRPLVWIAVLLVVAVVCKNKRLRNRLLILVLLALLFFSNQFVIGKIFNAYEKAPPKLEHYQIAIVLGGFSGYHEDTKKILFNSSADRFFKTIDLYKQGIVDQILISGGNSSLLDNEVKEADLAAAYLKKIGIPDSAILIENESRNTVENAVLSFKKVNEINPQANILVVTSAWHIPRARLNFSKYFKRNITYYPSNYIGKTKYSSTDYIRPSGEAFHNWNLIIKEWAGLLVDRFRG